MSDLTTWLLFNKKALLMLLKMLFLLDSRVLGVNDDDCWGAVYIYISSHKI